MIDVEVPRDQGKVCSSNHSSYYQKTVPMLFQQCSESSPCFMCLQAPEESFAQGSAPQSKNPKVFRSDCLKEKSGEECLKEC